MAHYRFEIVFWGLCFWVVGIGFFKWILDTDQSTAAAYSAYTIVPLYGAAILFVWLKKRPRQRGSG
ncbi:hypothetical protein [Alteribacter natronophilus]|uniref:hypothetical protein n=1 Tax=Alteribacter natronophilus TaxID=2583810 RepID=UPI00110E00D0|nr:hypothetical protein [Alteribacter natronophilus]TMW70886.1 hypothetical protein FGB90_12950 [Alteribacter natronophilus]